jgi:hypothetical protein
LFIWLPRWLFVYFSCYCTVIMWDVRLIHPRYALLPVPKSKANVTDTDNNINPFCRIGTQCSDRSKWPFFVVVDVVVVLLSIDKSSTSRIIAVFKLLFASSKIILLINHGNDFTNIINEYIHSIQPPKIGCTSDFVRSVCSTIRVANCAIGSLILCLN